MNPNDFSEPLTFRPAYFCGFVSTAIGLIVMKCGTNVHVPLRTNCNNLMMVLGDESTDHKYKF